MSARSSDRPSDACAAARNAGLKSVRRPQAPIADTRVADGRRLRQVSSMAINSAGPQNWHSTFGVILN
jgi:hypothetical protein